MFDLRREPRKCAVARDEVSERKLCFSLGRRRNAILNGIGETARVNKCEFADAGGVVSGNDVRLTPLLKVRGWAIRHSNDIHKRILETFALDQFGEPLDAGPELLLSHRCSRFRPALYDCCMFGIAKIFGELVLVKAIHDKQIVIAGKSEFKYKIRTNMGKCFAHYSFSIVAAAPKFPD